MLLTKETCVRYYIVLYGYESYQLVGFEALFLFVMPHVSDTRLPRRIHLLSVDFLYLVVGFITVANIIVRSLAFVTEFDV